MLRNRLDNRHSFLLLSLRLGLVFLTLLFAQTAHAQGTVTGVTVTLGAKTLQTIVARPVSVSAGATTGKPQTDVEWRVVDGPHYAWTVSPDTTPPSGISPQDASETSASISYDYPGAYIASVSCTVSYTVQKDDGTTATISGGDSKTVSVAVGKKWDAGYPIGEDFLVDSHGKQVFDAAGNPVMVHDGQVYSPQSQVGNPFHPKTVVRVPPGDPSGNTYLMFSTQAATDLDHWYYYSNDPVLDASGQPVIDAGTGQPETTRTKHDKYEKDVVHYTWTCSRSGFLHADPPGVFPQRVAYWIVPATTGPALFGCTTQDLPTAVVLPDEGDRKDSDLGQLVKVRVEDRTTYSKLRFYQDDASGGSDAPGAEIASDPDHPPTLGDKVWVSLEVQVGAEVRLDPALSTATVRITDNYSPRTATNNHADLTADLVDATGWEKWNGSQWQASPEPPSTENTGYDPARYRMKWLWDTTKELDTTDSVTQTPVQLLDSNGDHTVKLAAINGDQSQTLLRFQTINDDDVWETKPNGPNSLGADVENMVIESVSPDQYFLVQEGQATSIPFNVKLKDRPTDQPYTLTLTIRPTPDPTTVIKTITTTETGLNHTMTWDLTDDSGSPIASLGGYYTYDLMVSKSSGDVQHYRSNFLSLTSDDINLQTDADGDVIRNDRGQVHVTFKYRLSEVPQPNSVSINFYKDLVYLDVVKNLSEQNRWNPSDPPVDINLSLDEAPSVRGIMKAFDTHASEYRDHLPKPMFNWNKGIPAYLKYVAFTYTLVGHGNTDGEFTEWQKVKDSRNKIITPWHKINFWQANSGQDNPRKKIFSLNSDDPAVYWSPEGAIPVSNAEKNPKAVKDPTAPPTKNTVEENSTKKYWKVSLNERYDWEQKINGFCWRDSNGEYIYRTIKKKNQKPKRIYKGWRFEIHDDEDGDTHHPTPDDYGATPQSGGTVNRHFLRVHEDGGEVGTEGCVGLLPGTMGQVWDRFLTLKTTLTYWHTKESPYIPLMVYNRNGPPLSGPHDGNTWGSATK